MTETTGKKDTQKLQRLIVDALEDVKAQDIQVFDTAHLSPLFERIIIASGTSNRQTKALAASVRDKVREAGFPKPRIEGEDNGEWIIVDCGAAVAHVMQPTIRQYYNLEELWGDTPIRIKFGAPKPVAEAEEATPAPKKTTRRKPAAGGDAATAKPVAKKAATKSAAPKATLAGDVAAAPVKRAGIKNAAAVGDATPAAKRAAPKKSPAAKTAVTTVVVPATAKKAPAKKAGGTTAARKAPAKRPAAKKVADQF
jgi:ribosome-associated protein